MLINLQQFYVLMKILVAVVDIFDFGCYS